MKKWKEISTDDKVGLFHGIIVIGISITMLCVNEKERKGYVPVIVTMTMVTAYAILCKVDELIRYIKKD